MTPIAPHIEAFLREHLPQHRGASAHTCDSYAYSFQLLFEFGAKRLKVAPSMMKLEQLDASLISAFLEHLETSRQNSAETRNIRLAALRAWLAIRGPIAAPEVFVNAHGEPMSRWGFAYVLHQHAQMASKKCPSLPTKKLSPHVLRHTSAMIVLQATHDIRKVSLWLGHSNLATTEIYTRADPTEKLEAIEAVVPPHLRKGSFRPPDKLIALLKAKSAKS